MRNPWGKCHQQRWIGVPGHNCPARAVISASPSSRTSAGAGSPARLRHRLADEVADVLIYLVRFADVCGIDLLDVAYGKIGRNESRYPVELSRGNAAKYTNLPRREHDHDTGGES